ncbi:DUF4157 domain-containing protein [Streptomyces sp. NPDC086023]|uniref:eCIS core domain-containing protein n=1 Tax=Streptomyces sp. NPDC086023 TaxID=3365746 RepID=UPI0037D183A7
MNWPFRRRGGSSTGAGRQSGPAAHPPASAAPAPVDHAPVDQAPVDHAPAVVAPPAPTEPAAWRELPPLAGPLTAAGTARRLTAAPHTDQTLRAAGAMLATAAADRGDTADRAGTAGRGAEALVGRVEGLAKAVPLRHLQPRRLPEAAAPEFDGPTRRGGAPVPEPARAGAAERPAPAAQSAPAPAPDLPAPLVRRAAAAPAPEPAADLTRVTEGSVGEPRPATVSTHPPTWMNAGPIGADTDLASLLFPLPGDVAPVFPEAMAAQAADPDPRADPGARRTHLAQRRNLGQSRRLGLGTALSHIAPPDAAAPMEGEGRPPPGAEALPPAADPNRGAEPRSGSVPAPTTPEYRAEPPAVAPPALPDTGPPAGPVPAEPPARPPLRHRSPRSAPPAPEAPADLARAVSELHGVDVTGTPLHTGEHVTRMAQDMAAQAFTKNGEVYLPNTASALDSARTRGLIAHELTHVAQQKRYGGSLPPENSPAGRALEAEAISAERYFRGDPGAPAPLVHRRPVTSGPDPEEIRRMIARMAPVLPPAPPAPAPPPEPEPEPEPAPAPAPEPAYSGPDVSWTAGSGLMDGVQRASREEIIEEYLAELNHANRHRNDGRAALTEADLLNNTEHQEMIDFRHRRGLVQGHREKIINDFLAEKNFEQRNTRGDKLLTASDLQTDLALKDAIDFRLEEAARRGRLVADDNDDDVSGPQDFHWLKGEVGLNVVQGLASGFGITFDRKRRGEVRDFFSGRRPAAGDAGAESGEVFAPVGPPVPNGSPKPAAPPVGGPQQDNVPAVLAQPSVKAAAANNGTPPTEAGTGTDVRQPSPTQAFVPSIGPSGDDSGPEASADAGPGIDLWQEVKSSLWTAAATGFVHPPSPPDADEKKKAAEAEAREAAADAEGKAAVFQIDALGEDQLDALAHRLYGRVRDKWNSDQRRASAVHRERNGTKYR